MTEEQQVAAFKMHVKGATFDEIAKQMFPDAFKKDQDLTAELLWSSMHKWYRKQDANLLMALASEVTCGGR